MTVRTIGVFQRPEILIGSRVLPGLCSDYKRGTCFVEKNLFDFIVAFAVGLCGPGFAVKWSRDLDNCTCCSYTTLTRLNFHLTV